MKEEIKLRTEMEKKASALGMAKKAASVALNEYLEAQKSYHEARAARIMSGGEEPDESPTVQS